MPQVPNDKTANSLPPLLGRSLCADCSQCKVVLSGKGSTFFLCQRGLVDIRWPKYPPQPMLRCVHFQESSSR